MMLRLAAQPLVILLAVSVLCHGLLPFTDYVVWDDLWLMNWVYRRDYASIWNMWSESGNPPGYFFYLPFMWVENLVLTSKIVGFVSMFLIGYLAYRIARLSELLDSRESLLVGVISISLPAYKLLGGCIYAIYIVPITFILLGTLAALYAIDQSGWRFWGLRLFAPLLFLASFVMASMLTFYGAAFLLIMLVYQRRLGLAWYRIPFGQVFRHLDLVALPILYWMFKGKCCAPHGPYAGYNKIEIRADWFLAGYKSLLEVFADPFQLTASLPTRLHVLIAVLSLLLGTGLYWLLRGQPDSAASTNASPRRALATMMFGALALFFATVPYVLVGRTFGAIYLNTTYTPLVPIPFAILCVGVCQLLDSVFRRPLLLRAAIFGVVLAIWAPTWWHNYLNLEGQHVRNLAVIREYHQHSLSKEITYVRVKQDTFVPRTQDQLVTWIWTYLDCGISGSPRSIALNEPILGLKPFTNTPISEDEGRQYLKATTIDYAMKSINLKGLQADVHVEAGPAYRSAIRTGARYLVYKYFNAGELPPFLADQVRVTIAYPAAPGNLKQ